MRVFKVVTSIFILLLLNCEVTFNPTLREYIDDYAARTPLRFSIQNGQTIDGSASFNFGYNIASIQTGVVITNTESKDITLNAFQGITGDFTIAPLASFVLASQSSFTLPITYNPLNSPSQRVSANVELVNEDGRKFSFNLWGTSSTETLVAYSTGETELTSYDLGNRINEEQRIVLRNEGLSDLTVQSINTPMGITFNIATPFTIQINEEVQLPITYYDGAYTYSGDGNLNITTDSPINNTFNLPLFAGGPLNVVFGDGVLTGNVFNFPDVAIGSNHMRSFYVLNNTSNDIVISVSVNSDQFLTDLVAQTIQAGNQVNFNVTFVPTGSTGFKFMDMNIIDSVTNRGAFVRFEGNGI